MKKEILTFDLETTGLDTARDRIFSIAISRRFFLETGGFTPPEPDPFYTLVNPERELSQEVMDKTGMKNEDLVNAPKFSGVASEIYNMVSGRDLIGYNIINFDIPLLWEEFNRCGITWDLTGVRIIDAANIFRKKEERTLTAAYQFYCDAEMDGAHHAMVDVQATDEVLDGQLRHYRDLRVMSLDELANFSKMDNRVDLAGKIVLNADGVPVYNFGKPKGVPVARDIGFGHWILRNDFPEQTKAVIRRILAQDTRR